MHEWRSHTAEIELAIEADTVEQVFAEAVTAFGELVAMDGSGKQMHYQLAVESADREALLVEWLQELIFLADTESFVPERAEDIRLDGNSLRATLVGRRAPVDPLVKAATYHELRFADEDGVWHARVVLDV